MTRYKRQVKWTCQWMLGLAVTLRLVTMGWGSFLPSQQDVVAGLLFLETGVLVRETASVEPFVCSPVVVEKVDEVEPFKEESTEIDEKIQEEVEIEEQISQLSQRKQYTEGEAEAFQIGGTGKYTGDILPLLNEDLELDFSGESTTVLILHSHTCEAYAQTVGWEYVESDTARTQDSDNNMVRVGAVLAETLEAGGLSVIHDQTVHDYPDYNSSYGNALKTIEFWMETYPTITMVIDLHRDGSVDENGLPMAYTTTVDGVEVAQMMLVVGTDQGGLYYPDWVENFAFALQLQGIFLEDYPDYARPINLRTERFNQHATPANLLVEIGCHGNTLEEALASAEILGQGILALTDTYQGQ